MTGKPSCNNCCVVLPAKKRCQGMQDNQAVCNRYMKGNELMHRPFKRVLGSRMVHGTI